MTLEYTPQKDWLKITAVIFSILVLVAGLCLAGYFYVYKPKLSKAYTTGSFNGELNLISALNTNKIFPLVCGNSTADIKFIELTQICSGKTIQELCEK